MIASMVCPRCKTENVADQQYCQKCGYGLLKTDSLPVEDRAPDSPETSDAEELVGTTVGGKYRVLGLLGEGGFGAVYKVEQLLLGRHKIFALKLLHRQLSNNEHFRTRFIREASIAMELVHPNAIPVRDFGIAEAGQLYFTMDYCKGESLKEAISREGFLSLNRAISVTTQILQVLEAAHAMQIIHRDLKPENIFLDRFHGSGSGFEMVKVGDFGLARSVKHEPDRSDLTKGGIVGTPRYMSPEQSKGEPVDARADLYSVAVVFFEMIAGELPPRLDKTGNGTMTAEMRLREHLPPNVVVPNAVLEVIARALETKPSDRYQSAAEFREAIDRLPTYTPTYIEPREPRRRSRSARRRVRAVGIVLTLILLGFVALTPLGAEIAERASLLLASFGKTPTEEGREASGRESPASGSPVDGERVSAKPGNGAVGSDPGPGEKSAVNGDPKPAPPAPPEPASWGTLADWIPYRSGMLLEFEVWYFDQKGFRDGDPVPLQIQLGRKVAGNGFETNFEQERYWEVAKDQFSIESGGREFALLRWNEEAGRPLEKWTSAGFSFVAASELKDFNFDKRFAEQCLRIEAESMDPNIEKQRRVYYYQRELGLVRYESFRVLADDEVIPVYTRERVIDGL